MVRVPGRPRQLQTHRPAGRPARTQRQCPGIVLASLSLVLMPVLTRARERLGPVLGSQEVVLGSRQTELCAWLSAVVVLGLGLNALHGWWWADPVAALVLAAFATRETIRTWQADSLEDTCCT